MESLPKFIQRQQIDPAGIKHGVELPYDLQPEHVAAAMNDVLDYFHHINRVSVEKGYERLEELMLGNTYSGFLSELVVKAIPKYTSGLARNPRIGGHPDLVPIGLYPGNAVLHGEEGIEVKVSLQAAGWQGHNPEQAWIMVFQISLDRETEPVESRQPLVFEKVMIARLDEAHWSFSGREGASRRTPTASILREGSNLLHLNPIYERPGYTRGRVRYGSASR